MNSVVSLAPGVFQMFEKAWAPAAGVLAGPQSMMKAEHFEYAKLYLLALFLCTGLIKLCNPSPLKKLFKCLPDWSWTLGGLVELIASYYFYKEELDIAMPMMYTFLGAVMYTVLQDLSTMMIVPFPMSTVCLIFMYGKNAGIDSAGWIIPCALVGAFMALILGATVTDKKAKRS